MLFQPVDILTFKNLSIELNFYNKSLNLELNFSPIGDMFSADGRLFSPFAFLKTNEHSVRSQGVLRSGNAPLCSHEETQQSEKENPPQNS